MQNWRATLIPLVAVPVALVGTFAVMAALGYSLNNLSLFGLVLAIGIVVDDAIVVVENVERWLEQGVEPREAARRAMDEVTGPVIAVALVLCVRCSSHARVSWRRQRAVLPSVRGHDCCFDGDLRLQLADVEPGTGFHSAEAEVRPSDIVTRLLNLGLGWLFRGFNWLFTASTNIYVRGVEVLLRVSIIVLVVYAGLLGLTYFEFVRAPTGFIPQQDAGYLMLTIQLPDAASVPRTEKVMEHIDELARATPGVAHTGASPESR